MTPYSMLIQYEDEVIALRILAMYRLGMLTDVNAFNQFAECIAMIDLEEVAK